MQGCDALIGLDGFAGLAEPAEEMVRALAVPARW